MIIYSNIVEQLQFEFEGVIEPFQVSFFVSTNKLLQFDCILSTITDIEQGDIKSLYDIPPLLRLLSLEDGVVEARDAVDFFDEAENKICRILEWSEYIKRVVIFDLSGISTFDEDKFIKLTSINVDILDNSFHDSYKLFSGPGVID